MNLREAAMQALEALEDSHQNINPERRYADELTRQIADSITALRAALAEDVPETNFGNMAQSVDSTRSAHIANASKMVEPVAWRFYDGKIWCYVNHISDLSASTKFEPLYPAPPKREPLTEEEIKRLYDSLPSKYTLAMFARAVERAHGIGGEK